MDTNVFLDRSSPPTPGLLAKTLGVRLRYLDELKLHLPESIVEEWKYYGKTIGWTLKLLLGNRNLCFIVARRGYFTIAFTFGEKAVRAVEQSSLPKRLVQELLHAKKYVEGRGVRIEVKSRHALDNAKTLLDIKQQW